MFSDRSFCERLEKDSVRFRTSRSGREPAKAKQGGPGGKFEGRMEARMQKKTKITNTATTTLHITEQAKLLSGVSGISASLILT